jgi:4-amino-4-deoxychorismate lyase
MSANIFFYHKATKQVIDRMPNRTLFFGEGVFETFRYRSGLPVYFSRHVERLKKGCEFLNIPLPNLLVIKKFIHDCVKKSDITDAHVKICVFSYGGNRYQDYPEDFLLASIIKEYMDRNDEMTICVSKETKNSNSSLNFHKTTNYIQNIVSKRQAQQAGFDEALFLNEKDYVTECTAHNIFWLKNNIVFTPAVKNGLLPGITRSIIIEIAKDLGLQVLEGEFGIDRLKKADCIFLSNAISAVVTVKKLEGYEWGKRGGIYDKIEYNLLTRLKWN